MDEVVAHTVYSMVAAKEKYYPQRFKNIHLHAIVKIVGATLVVAQKETNTPNDKSGQRQLLDQPQGIGSTTRNWGNHKGLPLQHIVRNKKS
jgi:hypothetical protein